MTAMFRHRGFKITRSHKKKDKYTKKRPPLRKGQVIRIYVRDVSRKGDGVGKYKNFSIFVPGAKAGQVVTVMIKEVKKNCAVGKKLSMEEITKHNFMESAERLINERK